MPTKTKPRPRIVGDPEYEAHKGNCRNISHYDAAMESEFLRTQYREMWCSMNGPAVSLVEILHTLSEKKIPFVLTGAHGIAGWTGRPRATHDVDILVRAGRNHARAVKALKELYPHLEVRRLRKLTAFFIPGETESVIDVNWPNRADNAETLRTAIWISRDGESYRVPTLEAALGNKYGAILTLTRDPAKRLIDLADFMTMVKLSTAPGRDPIDLDVLADLGEMVWPNGGGEEIVRWVEDAKAGRLPNINEIGERG